MVSQAEERRMELIRRARDNPEATVRRTENGFRITYNED